jgi:NAD(P)-dependent dehydrogenase (short-subunit alcohol dehydrogenase family)
MHRGSVMVTGASSGIGSACVSHLARTGWTVFAGVRRLVDAEAIAARGVGDVRPVLLDVSDEAQVQLAAAELHREVGATGLHGLVNNAGIAVGGPFELLPLDDWRRQFDVNLFGAIALTRAVFDLVRVAGGRFVFIGSQVGRFSPPGMAPYAASKHALEAVCESMRHELAATPLHVSLVEPGNVRTPVWDKGLDQIRRIAAMLPDDRRADYAFLPPALRGIARDGATLGADPRRVARRVEHALTAERPRARYLVGPDAKLLGGVLTRLPDPARDRVLAALTRRWVRRGRNVR